MKSDEELLAAYVDGVAELTPEERARVEARLGEPEIAADRAATQGMIDKLRALPPEGNAPDWRVLERRIASAVDSAKPPWWRRWLVHPAAALAMTAAVAMVWLHRGGPAE